MASPAASLWREAQCEEYAAMRQLDVFDEVKFLKTTKNCPLILGQLDDSNLPVYADSNYSLHGDRKSQSGAVFKLAGSTVH